MRTKQLFKGFAAAATGLGLGRDGGGDGPGSLGLDGTNRAAGHHGGGGDHSRSCIDARRCQHRRTHGTATANQKQRGLQTCVMPGIDLLALCQT